MRAGGGTVQLLQDVAQFQSVVSIVRNVRQLGDQLSNSPCQASAGCAFTGGGQA